MVLFGVLSSMADPSLLVALRDHASKRAPSKHTPLPRLRACERFGAHRVRTPSSRWCSCDENAPWMRLPQLWYWTPALLPPLPAQDSTGTGKGEVGRRRGRTASRRRTARSTRAPPVPLYITLSITLAIERERKLQTLFERARGTNFKERGAPQLGLKVICAPPKF